MGMVIRRARRDNPGDLKPFVVAARGSADCESLRKGSPRAATGNYCFNTPPPCCARDENNLRGMKILKMDYPERHGRRAHRSELCRLFEKVSENARNSLLSSLLL